MKVFYLLLISFCYETSQTVKPFISFSPLTIIHAPGSARPTGFIRAENLADCPENYIHSPAGFYHKNLQGIYPVDNIINLMDIDLSKRL